MMEVEEITCESREETPWMARMWVMAEGVERLRLSL